MDNNGLHGLTLGSLFDGIAGFPFAAVLSGITPVWAAEVEPFCVAIARERFPDMIHYGDVSKINGADLPPVDIISFGSPCQDVSVAGKRRGIKNEAAGDSETTRSGLFFDAIRIIYEMRKATNGLYPTFIIWENVAGAFTSNSGGDFRTVLEEITKTDISMPSSGKWASAGMVRGGAICVCWRLFDAQYWGIPQRRKRIYLVGSFGSDSAAEILFKPDRVRGYLTPRRKARYACKETAIKSGAGGDSESGEITYSAGFESTAGTKARGIAYEDERSQTITRKGSGNAPAVLYCYDGRGNGDGKVAPTMTGDHNNRVSDYSAIVVYGLQGSMIGRQDKNGPQGSGINEDVCFTLNTSDIHGVVYAIDRAAFNQGAGAKYGITISEDGVNHPLVAKGPSAVAYQAGINGETAGTLDANYWRGPGARSGKERDVVFTAYELLNRFYWIVRLLMPIECERLQGYPDDWTVLSPIEDMTEEEYNFFLWVWKENKRIKGQKYKTAPDKKRLVRWYNKLCNDGSRYRALGNSLAIPCALRVVGGIADYANGGI